ncbi:hypothetical protein [Methylotenera sp.]|uniref:hypothetical protein n=1 Tax=Methylotenera sp. TaxID=2051956 RepID=UPI002EDAD55E
MELEKFYENTNFGNRVDGTKKGKGFLGVLKRPDGNISTEISIGVDFGKGETEIPLLVPTLSKKQIDVLLSLPDGEAPPDDIIDVAVNHAKKRLKDGKSPFADESESPK